MKKTIITAIFALIMTGVFANVNPIKKVTIDTEKSNVVWIGKKVTGKHTGTLNFQEGYLEMDGNTITGGLFIIDMTTLQVTDLVLKKDGKTATSTLSVDRTKYNIRYGSSSFFDGLKNKAINDVFELTANLVLK